MSPPRSPRASRPSGPSADVVRALDRPAPVLGGVVRLNRILELTGKIATAIWVVVLCSLVLGVEWKSAVEGAINSGKPLENALLLTVVLPTVVFLTARSLTGFARWQLQRELWRRDVQRLSGEEQR